MGVTLLTNRIMSQQLLREISEYWEAELLERQALVRNNYTIYAGILGLII